LEKYRIAFDNKGKYSNFDNFVNEFVELLAIIERNLEKKINATGDIGLRYINEFSLKFEDLGLFKISLNTGIKEIGLDFNAAYEVKNENVRSVVRVSRRVKNKDDVLIVFDIDSHMSCAGGEEVIGKFKHLRAEKNNIFFSNVNEKLIERWL
ncbi:MAG: TIGR04255 family protein, partial [Endomicrobium sp.]|jgi:uncharacterized protein (TIGR04255 family)|nr:TIGR04255 family protein [Endomicrobium sp.]